MVDIHKQVDYWRDRAADDLRVAQKLIAEKEIRQGLFFLHLSLEKMIKAHVCKNTNEIAPRIHNLLRLAEITNITMSDEQKDLLQRMNLYNLEGRYPDMQFPVPSFEKASSYLTQVTEMKEWLIKGL
jgi:HEPN domain-containing protein